ncbi:hypothetical protein Tco_0934334, partial [Tanacetum coccineum]
TQSVAVADNQQSSSSHRGRAYAIAVEDYPRNLEALGANGDVLEAFQDISRQIDEVRMEPGHEDTDFLKTPKTS